MVLEQRHGRALPLGGIASKLGKVCPRLEADLGATEAGSLATEQRMETVQHRRPLWIGLLACALTPTVLLVVELMGSSARVIIPVAVVLVVSLPASLLATYAVALPYVLWLRSKGKLSSLRLCVAGLLVGAAVLAAFNFYMNWYPQMRDHLLAISIALQSARKGATSGALLGLLASIALVVGAGIPFSHSECAKPSAL